MPAEIQNGDNLDVLAKKLLEDIDRRGLHPGDKYIIAREAGKLLNVSTASAHRVMKILADKDLLVRQRKSGTFVGPAFKSTAPRRTNNIVVLHVLLTHDYYRSLNFTGNLFVDAIHKAVPDCAVQIHYIPETDSFGYVRQFIDQVRFRRASEGVVLIRSSREIQEYAENSGVPTVIFGSVYPGINRLCSLDVDQSQTGLIMAQYVIGRGRKNIALITHSEWRSGDNMLLSSVTREMGRAGYGVDSLKVCSVPLDRNVIAEQVRHLFETMGENAGFLCRNDYYADIVYSVGASLGLVQGRDYDVVSGSHLRLSAGCEYPCVISDVSLEEQITKVADNLNQILHGTDLSGTKITIPVELSV